MNYTLDTNIITALLKNDERIKTKLQQLIFSGNDIFINAISFFEIKRGLLAANAATQLKYFEELCENFPLLLFDDREIFDRACDIYVDLKKRGQLIGDERTGDADILIAALALTHDLILVTDNIRHFQRIKNLIVENWLKP